MFENGNQEFLPNLMWVQRAKDLPSSAAFPSHQQEAEWELEQLGLEPAPIWDDGTAGRLLPC